MLGFSSVMFPCEMRLRRQCCWCTPECTGLENVVAVRNKSGGIGFSLSQTLSCEAALLLLLLNLTTRAMWSSIYMLIRRSICRANYRGIMTTRSLGCHSALAGIKCRGAGEWTCRTHCTQWNNLKVMSVVCLLTQKCCWSLIKCWQGKYYSDCVRTKEQILEFMKLQLWRIFLKGCTPTGADSLASSETKWQQMAIEFWNSK